jgi:hypothetical protein
MAVSWAYGDSGKTALDDVTRIATLYNATGAQTGTRPFTASENAIADAAAAIATAETNRRTIETALADALVSLQTIIDTANAQINAPAAIKDIARVNRRIIRLLIRRFDGTT